MSGTWQTLISALIGFAVLLITTLGPKLISFAGDWLEKHDAGAKVAETPEPIPAPEVST